MKNFHVRFFAGNPALSKKLITDSDGPHMRAAAVDIAANNLAPSWRAWVEHAVTGERIFENATEQEWRKRDGNREYDAPDQKNHASPLTGGWAPVRHNPTDGVTVFGHAEFGEVRVSWANRLYCIGPQAGHWQEIEGVDSGRGWQTRLAQSACDACAAQWNQDESEEGSNQGQRPSA